jgi:hypothetical protein
MFGIPKKTRERETFEYHTGYPVLTIERPSEDCTRTTILLNERASNLMNYTKGQSLAFSFQNGYVYAALVEQESDGKVFIETFQKPNVAGFYAYNKRYAEEIMRAFKMGDNQIAHFTLTPIEVEGQQLFELNTMSEFEEALKIQTVEDTENAAEVPTTSPYTENVDELPTAQICTPMHSN